jgi:hypothetical protein
MRSGSSLSQAAGQNFNAILVCSSQRWPFAPADVLVAFCSSRSL